MPGGGGGGGGKVFLCMTLAGGRDGYGVLLYWLTPAV